MNWLNIDHWKDQKFRAVSAGLETEIRLALTTYRRCVPALHPFRAISLLTVLGKELERVMVSRLKECYSECTSPHQFGFAEIRSILDANTE